MVRKCVLSAASLAGLPTAAKFLENISSYFGRTSEIYLYFHQGFWTKSISYKVRKRTELMYNKFRGHFYFRSLDSFSVHVT